MIVIQISGLISLFYSVLCDVDHRAPPNMVSEAKSALRDLLMRDWRVTALDGEIKEFDRRSKNLDTPTHHDTRYLFGDVIMTSKQVNEIMSSAKRQLADPPRRHKRRIAGGESFELWPKGQPIAFQFRPNVSENMRNLTRQAMQLWEGNTCVRFQVEIADPTCASIGIIAHEIGHSLGFFHEHTRPNRDMYIRLDFTNIGFGAVDNFALLMPEYLHNLAETSPYEYGSVMHYSAFAFADNRAVPTIIPQSGSEGYQGTMGQRQGPSFLDYFQINQIYCDNSCVGYLTSCRNGGYPNPNACWKCLCPSGFAGIACENVEASRNCPGAGVITVTESKKSIFTHQQSQGNLEDTECIWLLKAEANSAIRYEMINFDLPCDRVCEKSFVEIKAEKSWQRTGHRYCCKELPFEETRDSKGNQMVVMLRNKGKHTREFRMNFWAVPLGSQLPTTTSKPSNGNICMFLKSVNLYPCKNGGECKPMGGGALKCICPVGYSGTLCEEDIDECKSSPCQNGGTCLDDIGTYKCTCPPSFTGTQCENEIDFCISGPCRNGGMCKNATASHQCICLQNFVGSNCETEDRCLWLKEVAGMTPCNNGGVCVNDENGHHCDCTRGFSGVACETASVAPLIECQSKLDSTTTELTDSKRAFQRNLRKLEKSQQCEAKLHSTTAQLSDSKKKLEKCQKNSESELQERTKKVQKPQTKLTKCDHPPDICTLKRRNYQFAIIGGDGVNYLDNGRMQVNLAEITFWNTSDGSFHSVRNESWNFRYHSAAVLPDNTVLVTGGSSPYDDIDEFHLFNLSAGVNVLMSGHIPGPLRYRHSSAALSDGRVFVCTISLCSQFKNGHWKNVSSMVTKRSFLSMTSDDRYLYAIGGSGNWQSSQISADYYDPDTDSWARLPSLPSLTNVSLYSYPIVHVNGKVYAIRRSRVEILDTASKQWTEGPSLNTPRTAHSIVATPDGSIWVFGGQKRVLETTVEVLPAGGDHWLSWPDEIPRYMFDAHVVLV